VPVLSRNSDEGSEER